MNIGIAFDLRDDYLRAGYSEEETAEFDRESTIGAIETALQRLGHTTERIGNVRALAARLVAGDRWDLVFNIAEGLRGIGREAQVPALLDAYDIPYTFSDPLVAALTLHKAMTKRVLRDAGVRTTDFAVIRSPNETDGQPWAFPAFVKPLAEGTAKGIDGRSRVDSVAALRQRCADILDRFQQPAIVEPYLPGREVTVGVVGTGDDARAIGTLEITLAENAEPAAYTYVNKEQCESLCSFALVRGDLAREAESLALDAWRAVEARDGGRVDLRTGSDGLLYVMEINPLPGLHPSHSDLPMIADATGMSYTALIAAIVTSAIDRCPASAHLAQCA